MKKLNKLKISLILALAGILYLGLYLYFLTPTLNPRFLEGVRMLIPFAIGLYVWELKALGRLGKIKITPALFPFILTGIVFSSLIPLMLVIPIFIDWFKERKEGDPAKRNRFSRIILAVLIFYILFAPFISSSTLFRSSSYRDLIGEVKIAEDLETLYPSVDASYIRVVDQEMAHRLGEKVLGADPSIGSQSELGIFRIQSVRGSLYWVAPLHHSGFFKWQENRAGTRGYVMVSATDDSDVRLVQENNGSEVLIKYQPQAYLGDKLKRHIYFNGYMTRGFSDYTFEIDDNGTAYWVVTLYSKRVGFRGEDATGVLLVDCKTGELKQYSIEETPLWVDRIQPEDFIVDQLDDWGELVHGVLNFSDKDKLTTTPGLSLVYGREGRSYWYTGLTSVGSDEGTVGFVLVDTRTKETFWYKQAGATEYAARQSAEGKVQEKRYTATQPVMYNIGGTPTYLMSLTDDAGLVKVYAAVPVNDYTQVEVGETLEDVLFQYRGEQTDNISIPAALQDELNNSWQTLVGSVERIASEVEQGNTFYYLILTGQSGPIFRARSRISRELPLTRAGDSVQLRFAGGATGEIDLRSFDNLDLTTEE